MSHACTPILVDVDSPVSEILLLSKTAKFPFPTMDYLHPTCMHTNFGGCGLSGFGDIASFKNGQISLSDHGLVIKKFNQLESAQKIHASRD